jgi:hypothetical protein
VGILCRSKVLKDLQEMFEGTKYVFSGGARPQNWGGGHLRGKLIFGGGGQRRIFKKVLLFAHAVVTKLSPPPFQKGGGIPRNIEYPRNISPL